MSGCSTRGLSVYSLSLLCFALFVVWSCKMRTNESSSLADDHSPAVAQGASRAPYPLAVVKRQHREHPLNLVKGCNIYRDRVVRAIGGRVGDYVLNSELIIPRAVVDEARIIAGITAALAGGIRLKTHAEPQKEIRNYAVYVPKPDGSLAEKLLYKDTPDGTRYEVASGSQIELIKAHVDELCGI